MYIREWIVTLIRDCCHKYKPQQGFAPHSFLGMPQALYFDFSNVDSENEISTILIALDGFCKALACNNEIC